jgi:hypothetical protein
MSKISGISITIDGTQFSYEAHSFARCAEILASTVEVLKSTYMREGRDGREPREIDNFEIHYFQNN